MKPNPILSCLEATWCDYLQQRGHRISESVVGLPVIRSRGNKKARYRWLLVAATQQKHVLDKSELAHIRYHLGRAKEADEEAFLVVGFPGEPHRIIVLPADKALKARVVHSDKGGFDWE